MRPTSILTAAALAASSIVLSAGAASAQTAPNPDLRTFPTGPSCAAATVTGTVRVNVVASTLPKGARPTVVVQLRWSTSTAFADTSVVDSTTSFLTAGTDDYAFSLDATDVPANAKHLMAYAIAYPNGGSAPSETLQSKTLLTTACTAAPSATAISNISLSCSGDVVGGAVALTDPPASGTLPATVAVQGRALGATTWTAVGSKAFSVSSTTTSLPYEFSLAGKHTGEYRTRATVNNGTAVFSSIVPDTSCAPAEVVPEAPAAILIPLTLAATAGAVVVVRRRRAAASVAVGA